LLGCFRLKGFPWFGDWTRRWWCFGGANGITQSTHVPLGDSLLVVYFGIFLKYFEHLNLLKNLENFHHTIMLWFTSLPTYLLTYKYLPMYLPLTFHLPLYIPTYLPPTSHLPSEIPTYHLPTSYGLQTTYLLTLLPTKHHATYLLILNIFTYIHN
jgi:hypothetical protein